MFEKQEYDSHAKENFHCQSTKANARELEKRAKTFNNNQIFNNIMNIRIIIIHSIRVRFYETSHINLIYSNSVTRHTQANERTQVIIPFSNSI